MVTSLRRTTVFMFLVSFPHVQRFDYTTTAITYEAAMALLQTDNNELENYNPAKRITLSIQRVPMILIKSPLNFKTCEKTVAYDYTATSIFQS